MLISLRTGLHATSTLKPWRVYDGLDTVVGLNDLLDINDAAAVAKACIALHQLSANSADSANTKQSWRHSKAYLVKLSLLSDVDKNRVDSELLLSHRVLLVSMTVHCGTGRPLLAEHPKSTSPSQNLTTHSMKRSSTILLLKALQPDFGG